MGLTLPHDFTEWHNLEMYGDRPELYLDRITRDFDTIKPWLPARGESILDIGCGLAGVNVLLARATGAKVINLIDGNGFGPRKMGFVENTTAWFDVNVGAEFIRRNTSGLTVLPFWPDEAANDVIACDLLISLKSWGHHYPVEIYLGLAQRSVRAGGRMVLDIRTGTDGVAVLEASGFKSLGIAYSTVKADRHVFERVS